MGMAMAPSFSATLPNNLFPCKYFLASSHYSPIIFHANPKNASTHNLIIANATAHSWKWRTRVSFFPGFFTKGRDAKSLKEELYAALAPLDRGAEATPKDQQLVEQIARELEEVNEIKEPLKSNLLNGKWELIYTTSQSVLQTQRPKFLRPNGKIYQAINVDTLRAQNMETWPFFNQIPIKSPGSGRGQLEITYLDEELRVSRGDRGNLFILKMVDPSYRVPL
ncbi:hypothetical protein FH972_005534 [Carpinus fangiana]|uniref:Plastid lipid-associated protein/fibrillin conserved domain-containing protein n=1 Tax=Carpinus fangiana TaxID=176857 RepID=A0A5N6QS03_9ROSI|nr:hypothetical protein FH972_005534 [Carpinus fangiana]